MKVVETERSPGSPRPRASYAAAGVRGVAALRHLGYAPEASDLPAHLGVGELVALAALKRCDPPSPELADRLGVTPLLPQRLGSLSLGQRRRAGLLAALVGDPDLLVLDEPTNGLDADGIAVLAALLRERGGRGAALVATHVTGPSSRRWRPRPWRSAPGGWRTRRGDDFDAAHARATRAGSVAS